MIDPLSPRQFGVLKAMRDGGLTSGTLFVKSLSVPRHMLSTSERDMLDTIRELIRLGYCEAGAAYNGYPYQRYSITPDGLAALAAAEAAL